MSDIYDDILKKQGVDSEQAAKDKAEAEAAAAAEKKDEQPAGKPAASAGTGKRIHTFGDDFKKEFGELKS